MGNMKKHSKSMHEEMHDENDVLNVGYVDHEQLKYTDDLELKNRMYQDDVVSRQKVYNDINLSRGRPPAWNSTFWSNGGNVRVSRRLG